MTVVNPKSISGITSITTASGSDNLLTIHTSDASNTERLRIDSSGTASFAGDVSIADKIIHTGDTDTAIRFPAANTITAETSGSEALRILSSTAVIVAGTSAYSDGTFGEAKLQFNTKTGNHIGACSVADTNNSITHVLFKNPTGAIASVGTHNSDFIVLTGNAERLRIDSSGRMGLGTNSPDRQFEVNANSANTFIRIKSSDSGNAGIEFGDQSDTVQGAIFQNSSDNSLRFNGYNNSERMRIDSSGRLGLGEDSPGGYSSGAHNLVITAASGSNAGITINNDSGGTDSGAIFFAHGSGASGVGRIRYYHSDDHMDFYTANAERLRIDSSGRLLLAATSGTHRFHIKGNGGDGIKIENSGGTNAAVIDLKNTLTNYVQEYRIAVAGSDGAYGTAKSLFVRDQTSGANRFEVQAGGDVKVSTGNLIIGTAGKGINFSAFATSGNPSSNLLDDYEEGIATFTLHINGGAWSGVSYSSNTAPYVRVGRMVYCAVSMFATNVDGTTGTIDVVGLPFTDGGGGGYREPTFVAANHALGTNPSVLYGAIIGSTNKIRLRKAGSQDLNGSDVSSTFWFHGSLVYMA